MTSESSTALPLARRRILVPESRELDLLARLLERQGAQTLRCPLVGIADPEDPAPVAAWLHRLTADGFDDLILLTGEGLRRLLAAARRLKCEAAVLAALRRLRSISRGPKPIAALREVGLLPGLIAKEPTTQGVISVLGRENLSGRRVGVQLYPGNPNRPLIDFLRRAGAEPDVVVPYRYASGSETAEVVAAIRELAEGRIDAIAFTNSAQVAQLMEVAERGGLGAELRQGLARTQLAAVGPVTAQAVKAIGGRVVIQPDRFLLKPLVNAIRQALTGPVS